VSKKMAEVAHYDVAIIGAGIVGCSTAFALAKRGLKTLNLEALPSAGYGSTSASSAIIRPMYTHEVSACISHECRFIWQAWSEFVGLPSSEPLARYDECGGVMLLREGELEGKEPMMNAMASAGVTFEVISSEQLRRRFPEISLEGYGPPRAYDDPTFGSPSSGAIEHAIVVKEAGYVNDPQLAARNLFLAAQNLGASFQFNSAVQGISNNEGSFRLVTSQGEVIADKVVNAAGPHSTKINAIAGIDLDIELRALRHEVAYLSHKIAHFQKGPCLIVDVDAGVYQRPDGDDMLIGTTDPACDGEDVIDPDDVNMNLTDHWTRQAIRAAQRFPQYQIPNQAKGTVGVYDVSTDWIPVYDKTDVQNFYVAIGTSGNQFKNGPLIGEVMAEVIATDDHDQAPAQLVLTHIGKSIDLGFYSRNREIQETRGVMA